MSKSTCLNCGASEQDKPLLLLKFREQEYYICPQCMPTLIHKPDQVADKLPRFIPFEGLSSDDH